MLQPISFNSDFKTKQYGPLPKIYPMFIPQQQNNDSRSTQKLPVSQFYADRLMGINNNLLNEKDKIKKLTLLFLDEDVYKSLVSNDTPDTNNPKLKYLFKELQNDDLRIKVFDNLKNVVNKAIATTRLYDIEELGNLKGLSTFIEGVTNYHKYQLEHTQQYKQVAFKGDDTGECIISEGIKEAVGTALPLYRAGRLGVKIIEGDKKAIAKATIATADNIVLQPAKQAAAGAVALKGAGIGAAIAGPPGAAIGGLIGYIGTLVIWGKTRSKLVDIVMDDNR